MDHVMLHHPFYPFATHHTGRFRHANTADSACSEGLPLVTPLLGDTAARDDPAPAVSPMHRPHVGCHASRPMRPRICRRTLPVKWAFTRIQGREGHYADAVHRPRRHFAVKSRYWERTVPVGPNAICWP